MARLKVLLIAFLLIFIAFQSMTIFPVGAERQLPVEFPHYDPFSDGNYLSVEETTPIRTDTQKMYITEEVVDKTLRKEMVEVDEEAVLDLIVQFKGEVQANDLRRLRELGFEITHVYSVIPGVHCFGTKAAVDVLSRDDRVFWMEVNTELVYSMQGTTTVINATKTWYSDVLNFNGQTEGRIDGTGVTVAVLDSGVDAGHPDLDYKEKTIMNLKSDTGDPPWIEMENSDTSSGHGTHCAGTVGGNGDASGGARRGVAPGCNLIGLSSGELLWITGAVGGLDWVYEHSRPGNNPHNIKAVSNSWGAGGGEYDPQDSVSQASERIVYDNNVNVVFAAGSSGGDGSDIQCSNYGNTPANICVAALEHEGDGVASFSSRGQADLNGTWPDIGSPGVRIWSTAARRTIISLLTKNAAPTSFNPYYFAISGTSMATPHIAGICALIWQAYPGLGTSYVHDDYNGEEFPDWFNESNTLVHEVELVLEAAAHYIEPEGENGVPTDVNGSRGWNGKPYDYAQGYGMAMVDRAVAIALTLKELRTRDFDEDGSPDYPDASVLDAMSQYMNVTVKRTVTKNTDTVSNQWRGEWVKFNNQTTNPIPYYTDESHFLYIPEEANTLTLTLSFSLLQTGRPQVGTLSLVIDATGDGNPDWTQPISMDENKQSEIDLGSSGLSGNRGNVWVFNVRGHGVIMPFLSLLSSTQYYEARIPYTAAAVMTVDQSSTYNTTFEHESLYAAYGQWEYEEPSSDYMNGTITMEKYFFDLAMVQPIEGPPLEEPDEEFNLWPWLLLLALIVLASIIAYMVYRKKKQAGE